MVARSLSALWRPLGTLAFGTSFAGEFYPSPPFFHVMVPNCAF